MTEYLNSREAYNRPFKVTLLKMSIYIYDLSFSINLQKYNIIYFENLKTFVFLYWNIGLKCLNGIQNQNYNKNNDKSEKFPNEFVISI